MARPAKLLPGMLLQADCLQKFYVLFRDLTAHDEIACILLHSVTGEDTGCTET